MLAAAVLVAPVASADKGCWVDPDTPEDAYTTVGPDKLNYELVFSDEFNQAGRKFANGHDAKWTALNIGDTSNKGTAFYLPSQATIAVDTNYTQGGPKPSGLLITTENASHTGDSPTGERGIYMPYKSAMLQTWDKARARARRETS